MIRLVVFGVPGPQGSKAFKGINRKTGRAIMVESSKKVKPWRERVVEAAQAEIAELTKLGLWDGPMDGPLRARMIVTIPKPASAPKRTVIYPIKYPDVSKLARSTEDALTTARVWADDARLLGYDRLWKCYPNEDPLGLDEALPEPGVLIIVRSLHE